MAWSFSPAIAFDGIGKKAQSYELMWWTSTSEKVDERDLYSYDKIILWTIPEMAVIKMLTHVMALGFEKIVYK